MNKLLYQLNYESESISIVFELLYRSATFIILSKVNQY